MVSIKSLMERREAVLVLSNGKIFHGTRFGVTTKIFSELYNHLQLAEQILDALEDLHERGIYDLKTYYKKVITRSLDEYHNMLREIYW